MPETIDLGALVTGLGGGLALFLYGMRRMTEALKTVAGGGMKTLLSRLTHNRFTAALAGAIVTGVIQSSSVTTVLIVGFISAGLLNLNQSIGVILGANVGTTLTAQIIAFKIYQYGLLMIAIGFLADVVARREEIKQWGMALMGLGLVFFGMELMSVTTVPLRAWPPFIDLMRNMEHPLLGIVVGMLFTAIVQSSSATTGIVIVLAGQGLISLESGIGLVLGANVGTCVTAIASSFGRPRQAVQAACAHVVFNVGGVLLWMFFIPQFADVVRNLSPTAESLAGTERLAAETPRQIANAHTLFNVANALLFIWFTGPLARLVERIVPKRPEPEGVRALYLDELYLDQPAMALDQVRRELVHLAETVRGMLGRLLTVVIEGSRLDVTSLSRADNDVDTIQGAIVTYLGKLTQKNLVEPQPRELSEYLGIANDLESLGDVIEDNLAASAAKRLRLGVRISPTTVRMLQPIHEKVCWAFDRAVDALRTGDRTAAQDAAESKAAVNDLASAATAHVVRRLVADEPNRLAAFQLETDIIENLKRLNTHTRRIGRALLRIDAVEPGVDERAEPPDSEREP